MVCSQCGGQNPSYVQFCMQCACEFSGAAQNVAPRAQRPPLRPAPAPVIEGARRMQGNYEPLQARVVMPLEPKPYDYRLPYRPARPDTRVSQYAQPRQPRAMNTYAISPQSVYYPDAIARQSGMQLQEANSAQSMREAQSMRVLPQPPRAHQGGAQQAADYAYYPQEPEAYASPKPQAKPKQPQLQDDTELELAASGKKPRRSAFRIIAPVAIVLLLIGVIYFGLQYVNDTTGGALAAIFDGLGLAAEPQPTTTPSAYDVMVEAIDYEGKSARSLKYTGKDGESIRLDDFDDGITSARKGGQIAFTIVDARLIPQTPDPDREEIEVHIAATLLDKDGAEIRKLKVQPIVLKVPQVELSLTAPELNDVTVDSPVLDIAGTLSPKARLSVDGTDISQVVSATGAFTHSLNLPGFGEHTITLTASADHYRDATVTLHVNYPKKDIVIEFAEDSATRTSKATASIKGTVEAGAEAKLDGEIDGEFKFDKATGEFSFTAKLTKLGLNTFTITASKDGIETQKTLYVEKVPNVDQYTPQALKMDYPALAKNPAKYKDKIFLCVGKVASISQQEPYHMFVFDVGSDAEQHIQMEYYGTMQLQEDSKYRIFGDVAGVDEQSGLPLIIARFIYVVD